MSYSVHIYLTEVRAKAEGRPEFLEDTAHLPPFQARDLETIQSRLQLAGFAERNPSKLGRDYMRPALKRAKIVKPFRVWHDMRHTALTHEAAAGNPMAYVQLKAGHSQSAITERYIHAAQVMFPGAAARGEARIFGRGLNQAH